MTQNSGIPLNGEYVRLGRAQDVLPHGQTPSRTYIEFDPGTNSSYQIELSAPRAPEASESSTQESVRVAQFTIVDSESGTKKLKAQASKKMTSDEKSILENLQESGEFSVLRVATDGLGYGSRLYLVFQGFVPILLAKFYTPHFIEKSLRNEARETIRDLQGSRRNTKRSMTMQTPSLRRRIVSSIMGENYDDFAANQHASELIDSWSNEDLEAVLDNWVKSVDPYSPVFTSISRFMRPELRQHANEPFLEAHLAENVRPARFELSEYSDAVRSLRSRIRYIGPLRDEPRVMWSNWGPYVRGLPLGSRGERTAEFYSRNSARSIFASLGPHKQVTQVSLSQCAAAWLQYLEIGTGIKSTPYGKTGIGLEVEWNHTSRDLTSLGVGVSQAVPIIIAGLATEPGSIMIIEQPELHLHPDVQAKLADFFLYCRNDISFVIETHSDHMITRTRRRVAEGLSPDLVNLIFIEIQSGPDYGLHGSYGRQIEFTRTGDLSEWPKGFISGGLDDARAIMKAVVRNAGAGG